MIKYLFIVLTVTAAVISLGFAISPPPEPADVMESVLIDELNDLRARHMQYSVTRIEDGQCGSSGSVVMEQEISEGHGASFPRMRSSSEEIAHHVLGDFDSSHLLNPQYRFAAAVITREGGLVNFLFRRNVSVRLTLCG